MTGLLAAIWLAVWFWIYCNPHVCAFELGVQLSGYSWKRE
jgi:hypothetical protein